MSKEWLTNLCGIKYKKKSSSVEIITGNSDQMKLVVKESLIDYNLNPYEEIFNQGKIIVKLN